MDIKEVAIGGIERHSSAQDAPSGVCEELINIRPATDGIKVYKEGTAISSDLDLSGIHLHRWGGQVYYIGITPGLNVVRFALDGTAIQTLKAVSSVENTSIASIGNMLIISDKGENEEHPSTTTYVLEEKEGVISYTKLNREDIPMPQMDRADIQTKPFSDMGDTYTSNINHTDGDASKPVYYPARNSFEFLQAVPETVDWTSFKQMVKDTLKGVLNRVMDCDKHIAHGYVLLGVSVTLYDGTETAFGNLLCVDLSNPTPYRDEGNLPPVWQFQRSTNHYTYAFPQKDSLDGLFFNWTYSDGNTYWKCFVDSGDLGGTNVKSSYFHGLNPKIVLGETFATMKDYIKSVSLWVSKPIDKIDWESYDLRMGTVSCSDPSDPSTYYFVPYTPKPSDNLRDLLDDDHGWQYFLYPFAHIRRMGEMKDEMHKQLLFRQKEWTVQEILDSGGSVVYECEFGSSGGTLGDTLSVDAWNNKRAGRMFIYNNRVHMFDSVVKVEVPDKDLQSLSGWDDEYYIGKTTSIESTGQYWHLKIADNNSISSTMEDITPEELFNIPNRMPGANSKMLGLNLSASPQAPTDYTAYDWYYIEHLTHTEAGVTYPYLYLYHNVSFERAYVVFSTDRLTLTPYVNTAKYMALESAMVDGAWRKIWRHPDQLNWYDLPAESYEEGAVRNYRNCTVVATLKESDRLLTLRHENIPILFDYTTSGSGAVVMGNTAILNGFITYPDTRCQKIAIQYQESGYTYGTEISMSSENSSYNFAYAYVKGNVTFGQVAADTAPQRDTYPEKDVVNVSALNNPTVFPVTQSYHFIGDITDMALALEELNVTQTGIAPVYVLTERGVFALYQGTGGVLYSSISPINTDVCEKGRSTQVRSGIAYVANGRLYWLIGRSKSDILLPLDGKPDLAPRTNASYPLACEGSLYDVTNLLSNGLIATYLQNAALGYDSFHDELYLSNPSYTYTYVFNFPAKRWFKVTGTFGSMDDHHLLTRGSGGVVSDESPATGIFTLGLLDVEAGARITYNWVAYNGSTINLNNTFNSGDTLTLRIGVTVLSSITLKASATLPAVMSLLTANLGWIETDVISVEGALKEKVYISSIEDFVGQSLTLTDDTTGISESFPITASSGTAVTTDKMIGSVLTLSIEDPTGVSTQLSTAQVTSSSSVGSICRWMAGAINAAASVPFTATSDGNVVSFVSNQSGSRFNGWYLRLSVSDPLERDIPQTAYITTSSLASTGGEDATSISPASGSIRLLDMTQEREDGDMKIHLQTRPMKLTPMAFGVVERAILRLRATLSASENLSMYLFSSDNLKDYKCTSAEQRSGCSIDRIRLERTAHGRKYTVLIIGGIVPVDTELSSILFQLKTNAPKHIR